MAHWHEHQRHWQVVERLLDHGGEARQQDEPAASDADKILTKNAYDGFNRKLNALKFGRYAYFLNYGYVANDSPCSAVITPPDGQFDANSRRLVLEVIGDCPLDGRDVLDVSCGRGSVATVLREYFRPRSYHGIDISSEAIAFCRRHHQVEGFAFDEGDAEAMTVADGGFDVVINIEASHTYPRVEAFLAEVHRVLRPGGFFLYTDLGSPRSFDRNVQVLRALGFETTRDVDISANVMLACSETAARRLKAYRDPEERAFMADFLAAPDSRTGRAFADGSLRYRLFTFRKPT